MQADKILFGTDGWRDIIADNFTIKNVQRVAVGTALWLQDTFTNPSVIIGNDCRFGGVLFRNEIAKIMAEKGIKVTVTDNAFVTTPMISYAAYAHPFNLGIMVTASHNPPSYNGYKVKTQLGCSASVKEIKEIEARIPDQTDIKLLDYESYVRNRQITLLDIEDMYKQYVEKYFDITEIKKSGFTFAYDSMFGAGQKVMADLFPHYAHIHYEHNPGFKGIPPEPIEKNLQTLSECMIASGEIDMAFATDGDGDRIGVMNHNGTFIDSHHIMLLLIYYLVKEKKMKGKVIYTISCCSKIKKLCDLFGLDTVVCPVGFKYIAEVMNASKEPYLLGGEESGGIAIQGNIPERDGIWIGLTLLEMVAKTEKTLDKLVEEIYELVGAFACRRIDLHINAGLKESVIENCTSGKYKAFGNYHIQHTDTLDGFKFIFDEHHWAMIRPSGTEAVLRIYSEAPTPEAAEDILKEVKKTLL